MLRKIHLLAALLGAFWVILVTPESWGGETDMAPQTLFTDDSCAALAAKLEDQEQECSRQLRQIKREMAMAKQEQQKPGLKEVFSGLGYIVGLFGFAAYYSSRRRRGRFTQDDTKGGRG